MAQVGDVACRLELSPRARIHNVFRVSILKKFEGSPTSVVPLPDLLHGRAVPTPEKVLRARLNRGVWELLVQWVGRPWSEASWEPLLKFKTTYPMIQLEGKLFVGGGGMLSTILLVANMVGGRWLGLALLLAWRRIKGEVRRVLYN